MRALSTVLVCGILATAVLAEAPKPPTAEAAQKMVTDKYKGDVRRDEDLVGSPIVRVYLRKKQVADGDLALLEALPDLIEVDLTGSRLVGDKGIAVLPKLTKLQSLGLADTQVTDAGLATLKDAISLESLDLTRTRVGDKGLRALVGGPKLKSLGLHGTAVTDASLATFKEMPTLEKIDLGKTRVTPAGIRKLKEMGLTVITE